MNEHETNTYGVLLLLIALVAGLIFGILGMIL